LHASKRGLFAHFCGVSVVCFLALRGSVSACLRAEHVWKKREAQIFFVFIINLENFYQAVYQELISCEKIEKKKKLFTLRKTRRAVSKFSYSRRLSHVWFYPIIAALLSFLKFHFFLSPFDQL